MAPSDKTYDNCTQVTPSCPLSATTYGYAPNVAANAVFLTLFSLLFLAHIPLAYRYRLWSYSTALGIGCLMELIGYAARILMHSNPWNNTYFPIQITCLIIAPSFVAASIYLTLKHLIMHYGPENSRLKPRLYTWVFIGCDVVSILIQATGGGVAASAHSNLSLARIGNGIIIGGIAFQVVTMAACGLLAIDFAVRYRKNKILAGASKQFLDLRTISRPVIFCVTSAFAYVVILIRCIYRVPEMAGGWGNPLMRHEDEFLILDGLMVVLGVAALTLSYPGYMFPGMMKDTNKTKSRGSQLTYEEMTKETV